MDLRGAGDLVQIEVCAEGLEAGISLRLPQLVSYAEWKGRRAHSGRLPLDSKVMLDELENYLDHLDI